jgi:2-oxo-4-hydroxy-4-carboxy-5-ureidoimidazoline decarboxylase
MDAWRRVDLAPAAEAAEWLFKFCGSPAWVARMLARRPFGSREALLRAAREEWFALPAGEWHAAMAHHPRLGDREALRTRFAGTRALSAHEQAGITSAPDDVLDVLADANQRYERKFGYIFIACAAGRPASAILEMIEARMSHDPETEIRIAAEELAKITARRLESTELGT